MKAKKPSSFRHRWAPARLGRKFWRLRPDSSLHNFPAESPACERRAQPTASAGMATIALWYNFARINSAVRISPAMAARLETSLGEISDIVNLIEEWEAGVIGAAHTPISLVSDQHCRHTLIQSIIQRLAFGGQEKCIETVISRSAESLACCWPQRSLYPSAFSFET